MNEVVKGFLTKLNTKNSPPGARRPWTLYSGRVELESGDEYGDWISFGFDNPGIAEGDYIEFQIVRDGSRVNAVKGTLSKPKNPPARAGARAANKSAADNGDGLQSSASAPTDVRASTGTDRQSQIVMQHSQEMGIAVVALLLQNDGLPTSGAKTKAGEAKRYEEIIAAVDKMTVKFYNDVVTGRLLITVADTVTTTAADGPIPPAPPKEDDDDLPF